MNTSTSTSTSKPVPGERNDADDATHMRRAIALSRAAAAAGDGPYGAVAVRDGRVVAEARNRRRSDADVTAHAEMLAVRAAQQAHGDDALRGATVYASGEPCAMCAGAMFWAGVRRVVYAAPLAELVRVLGGDALAAPVRDVLAGATPAVRVDGPLLEDEAVAALEDAAAAKPPEG